MADTTNGGGVSNGLDSLAALMSEPASYGVAAALIGVGAAAIGWLVKLLVEQAIRYYTWRKRRKEALIFFLSEVLASKRNCSTVCSDEQRRALLRKIALEPDIRPYVESYETQPSPENIVIYLASLSEYEIALISTYIEYSGLYQKYYTKLGSEEFKELPPSRKKDVLKELFRLATIVKTLCVKLEYTLKRKHRFLARVREQYGALYEELELE